MNQNHPFEILLYHKQLTKLFGIGSHRSLGWKDKESQNTRFYVLSSIGDLNHKKILDIGCGYGDLYFYLQNRYQLTEYVGIDSNLEFIEFASNLYKTDPIPKFIKADFNNLNIPIFDFIFASGIFNYNSGNDVMLSISTLYHNCTIGFGFNMLDINKFSTEGILKGHSKNDIYEQCKAISTKTKLIDNYSDEDFTIFMYK